MTMRPPCLLIAALLFCATDRLIASPRSDLSSISQETRDAAAKILRGSYSPPPRTRWEPIVDAIKIGDSKDKILEQLRPFSPTPEMCTASGGSYCDCYRLDDLWLVRCCYRVSDDTLFKHELVEFLRWVWVAPPSHFSGVWVTYFPNGQRSHEIHYQDGQYSGEVTTFRFDGSKCVVQRYGPEGVDGEDTGFFPSGGVKYRGNWKAGKQVGTWTWYKEDGSIRSTREPAKQ